MLWTKPWKELGRRPEPLFDRPVAACATVGWLTREQPQFMSMGNSRRLMEKLSVV